VATVKRADIYERDDWTCYLCGDPVERTEKVPHRLAPTLDHILPLARGGTHEPSNVATAHFICNAMKSDRLDRHGLPLAS
jgi:5-methylcytosine-specific restriction endonuclease McrA